MCRTYLIQVYYTFKEFTGEEKVQNIAKNFLDQEEENFGMFKYVNFLNKEMEELSDSLSHLQAGIGKFYEDFGNYTYPSFCMNEQE